LSASVVEDTQGKGYAAVGGTLVPGVSAVAVPIFDHKNRVVAVLGALGRDEEMKTTAEGAVLRSLRETAVREAPFADRHSRTAEALSRDHADDRQQLWHASGRVELRQPQTSACDILYCLRSGRCSNNSDPGANAEL